MQLKPITTIIVLSLVVASLLVTGCTTSTTNQTPNASTTPSAATQHAFLENYLAAYKNVQNSNSSQPVTAWELTWINNTSARLQWTTTTNVTWNYNQTFMVFPTTQDATNYFNAINKTNHSLTSTSTQYPSRGPYLNATGHAPQIYILYYGFEGDLSNISGFRAHTIVQVDNIVVITTATLPNEPQSVNNSIVVTIASVWY